jgi:hypothetical protein
MGVYFPPCPLQEGMKTGRDVYLRCAFAGVVAVIGCIAVVFVAMVITIAVVSYRVGSDWVLIAEPEFIETPLPLFVLILAFVAGFWRKYHQIASR